MMKKCVLILFVGAVLGGGYYLFKSDPKETKQKGLLEELVEATIEAREDELLMTLPANLSESSGVVGEDYLLIRVNADGGLKINAEDAELSNVEVAEELDRYAKECEEQKISPTVQLHVSVDTTQKHTIDVLNLLRKPNIHNVTFKEMKQDESGEGESRKVEE